MRLESVALTDTGLVRSMNQDSILELPELGVYMVADGMGGEKAGEEAPGEKGGSLPTPTLAELYIQQGMPEKAAEVYEKLLEDDPDNKEIRERLSALGREAVAPKSPARRKIQALQGWLKRIKRNHDAQGSA